MSTLELCLAKFSSDDVPYSCELESEFRRWISLEPAISVPFLLDESFDFRSNERIFWFPLCDHLVRYVLLSTVARKVVRQQVHASSICAALRIFSQVPLNAFSKACILQSIIHCCGVGAVIAPDFSCVMLLLYQWLAVERKLAPHHEVIGCSERRMQLDCRDVVVVVRDYHIQKRPKTSIMAKVCWRRHMLVQIQG